MLLSISVLLFNRSEITKKFLKSLESILNQRKDVEVIIRNNGSIDNSEEVVFQCGLRNLVYVPDCNRGFPEGHNENLKLAKGKYFLVLNNDLIFHDHEALEKLIAPLEQYENVGLSGLSGTYCSFRPDGTGFKGNKCEYIEGSCLCGRTEDFRQHGLFSPNLKMFFFEDSDISLRYRQMGYDLAVIDISHEHQRSQSLNLLKPEYKAKFMSHNSLIFKKRWASYLVNRTFSNRILVKIESLGIGDVLAMSPVLEGLRRDHPGAVIELTTSYPELFLGNPYLSELYEIKRNYNRAYDRMIDIRPTYASYELLAKQAETICGTKVSSYRPQVFLSQGELLEGQNTVDSLREDENTTVVGIALQMERTEWEGRNYSLEQTKRLIELLQGRGVKVIEFGKGVVSTGKADLDLVDQLRLREFMSIVASVDFMVCIDSLALHIAQALSTPTFCLFGATSPIARIVDWSSVYPIFSDIACLFCYQKKGPRVPDQNKCELNHSQVCMNDLSAEEIMKYVEMDRAELLARNTKILQEYIRKDEI